MAPATVCYRWGPMSPPPKRHNPQFSVNICCGQMARWIKMPLCMEVGFDPSDIVLDGDPAPPSPEGGQTPNFQPMSIVVKRLHGSKCHLVWSMPRPRPHCVRLGPRSPSAKRRHSPLPTFGPCCYGQTAGWIKMSLGTMVGLGPGHIVLHGDPARPPKMVGLYCPLQYSAHVYCDQRVVHLSYC